MRDRADAANQPVCQRPHGNETGDVERQKSKQVSPVDHSFTFGA